MVPPPSLPSLFRSGAQHPHQRPSVVGTASGRRCCLRYELTCVKVFTCLGSYQDLLENAAVQHFMSRALTLISMHVQASCCRLQSLRLLSWLCSLCCCAKVPHITVIALYIPAQLPARFMCSMTTFIPGQPQHRRQCCPCSCPSCIFEWHLAARRQRCCCCSGGPRQAAAPAACRG
jgi:hypothetical protein